RERVEGVRGRWVKADKSLLGDLVLQWRVPGKVYAVVVKRCSIVCAVSVVYVVFVCEQVDICLIYVAGVGFIGESVYVAVLMGLGEVVLF
ncbi:hypothetical protein AAHH80_33525, partial [Burkholderia pseudomallei]